MGTLRSYLLVDERCFMVGQRCFLVGQRCFLVHEREWPPYTISRLACTRITSNSASGRDAQEPT